jgi:hypothetical protein
MSDSDSCDERLVRDYVKEIAALASGNEEGLVVAVEILKVVQKALHQFGTVANPQMNLEFMAGQLKTLADADQPREIKGAMLYAQTLVVEALQEKRGQSGGAER